ncbi:MAG: YihY/virulence factor BrkB family protein [Flavobacteriaceae bacterium]|nr:YihY/virulence factor BrkB family protein [Flavobacteriaceae bacterium]
MSLKELLNIYATGIIKGALTARASSIAFSFFLALFPFSLFLLTLIPYVPIDGFQEDFISLIFSAVPSQSAKLAISSVLNDIATNKYGELVSFGFLMAIFLMTNGVNAILNSFEYTFHGIETRTVVRQYIVSLLITLLLAFLLIITVTVIVILEVIINKLDFNGLIQNVHFWNRFVQVVLLILFVIISLSLLFYYGTKEGRKLSFFSPGTILTTILLIINFKIFGSYIEKFGVYNRIYGSIGTVIVIMLFIYLNSIVLLLGFELNTSISKFHNRRIKKDQKKSRKLTI